MDVNHTLYFPNTPTEITFHILRKVDCSTLQRVLTVCKEWYLIITEFKEYQEFKIFRRLTISKSTVDHPGKKKLQESLLQLILNAHLLNRQKVEKILQKSGKEILNYGYNLGLTPLLFMATTKLFKCEEMTASAKMLLNLGGHVNIATYSEINKDLQDIDFIPKHATALWIAAVQDKFSMVLCLKSRGGVVYPPLNPLIPLEADALALLKKADDELFTAPVRLLEGHRDKGSSFSLLFQELIDKINWIFFSSFR